MTSRLTTVSFHCLLVGLAPLVDFDDHNKLLGVTPEPLSPRTGPG
jgi:hypothetical protein